MPAFPSADWFAAVRDAYNNSKHSGGGGACNTEAGLCIGDEQYLLVFAGNEVTEARPANDGDLDDTDFNLVMSRDEWIAMVKNVQENGHARARYTLNSLDLHLEDGLAHSPVDDQYRQDLFYRYNQNFQDFFDASASVETTF